MSGRPRTHDYDDVVRRYLAGEPIKRICPSDEVLYRALRMHGLEPNRKSKLTVERAREIAERYLAGELVKNILSNGRGLDRALAMVGVARNRLPRRENTEAGGG